MFLQRQCLLQLQPTLRTFSSVISKLNHDDLQSHTRKVAEKIVQPVASAFDAECKYPREQIQELAKQGYMGLTVPREYGGCNLDMRSVSIAVEELSRCCASTGAIVSIHNILYADLLASHGNARQKDAFLKPYITGTPGSFALSEIDAGSDVANISTTAIRDGDTYVLNGRKSWVTSALQAEVAVIFATLDKEQDRDGITAFIVPLSLPGIECVDRTGKLGIRATSTCEIILTDVRVPCENILGDIGDGFKMAMQQLNKARIGIASQAIGIAQSSLDTALDYALERQAFGRQLIDFQAVQLRLARMATQVEGARLLVRKAAKLCDKNQNFIKASSMAKLMASETATFASHQCIQILGALGYTNDMPAERFYRDARVTEIYGGVSDIQMLIITDQLLREHNDKR